MAKEEFIVVLITAATEEEAKSLGKKLVQQRLVACVNIIPKLRSIFQWEGKVAEEDECLMILKTQRFLFQRLEETVRADHSYDIPEIIALPITAGSQPYMSWVHDVTQDPDI